MRVSMVGALLVALVSAGSRADQAAAQDATGVRVATATPAASQMPKFTFILFWKENNAATQGMTEGLKAALAKRSQRAEWTSVNVNDSANRPVVDRFQVERAPMPMVLCVAHNGAITGAMVRQVSEQAVENALVTPAMVEATKALQDKKIVVVHVKQDARQPLPAGASQFMQDPNFKDRSTTVNVLSADPAESRFVREMKIQGNEASDSVVLLAPPGVLVGKYPGTVTTDQLAAALHAAGKCCTDPNCKHNQKGR